MSRAALADLVLIVHAAFALFVISGGFLALRWPQLRWWHLPAALWGAAIEFGGWICPLTPLESRLRSSAGQAGYSGDFIAHYLGAALYPPALTRALQLGLGLAVVAINAIAYALAWRRLSRRARLP